jgi:DNA-binding PadR family transcriptional regulator
VVADLPSERDLTEKLYIGRVGDMSLKMRRSPQTSLVLAEFLSDEKQWRYGYDISRNTGLKSGTLYPILMRLAEHRMLKTSWETTAEGRPPRHMYKLTRDGLRYARVNTATESKSAIGLPALGEAATS